MINRYSNCKACCCSDCEHKCKKCNECEEGIGGPGFCKSYNMEDDKSERK